MRRALLMSCVSIVVCGVVYGVVVCRAALLRLVSFLSRARVRDPSFARRRLPIAAAVAVFLSVGMAVASDTPPGRYRSNEIGMAIESIREGEDSEYILEVRDHRDGIERVLLHEDEVQTRILTEYERGRAVSETEWSEDRRIAEREFDREGRLIEEARLEDGQVRRRSSFEYADGRLAVRVDTDSQGAELAREEYSYRQDGFLRRVERRFEGGGRGRSEFLYSGGALVEEWHERGEAEILVRYDAYGRLELTEERDGGEVLAIERRYYDEDGESADSDEDRDPEVDGGAGSPDRTEPVGAEPVRVEVERPSEQTRTVTEYDDGGRRIGERRWESGELIVERSFEYAAGELSREVVERDGSVEERLYEYNDDGDLVEEERLVENVRSRRIRYQDEGRVEERYEDGELALIIEYHEERRVREQVVRDGEVVREREF